MESPSFMWFSVALVRPSRLNRGKPLPSWRVVGFIHSIPHTVLAKMLSRLLLSSSSSQGSGKLWPCPGVSEKLVQATSVLGKWSCTRLHSGLLSQRDMAISHFFGGLLVPEPIFCICSLFSAGPRASISTVASLIFLMHKKFSTVSLKQYYLF